MTTNPILSFELRSRWRMGRSFLLVLVIALVLSVLTGFVYRGAVERAMVGGVDSATGVYVSPSQNYGAQMAQVGRDLFVALVGCNSLLWLFLAGALAASGVARERERGLLESLQLSQMSARSQIAARFAANGLMLLVLQLVTLPIYAVAFWMGGTAPSEMMMGLATVVWAAMLGGALGLWYSARSHRPTSAVFGVLGTLVIYSLVIYWNTANTFRYGFGLGKAWSEIVYFSHPTSLFYRLSSSSFTQQYYFDRKSILVLESALWAAVCLWLLRDAAEWVGRTLPPPAWQGRAPWLEKSIAEHRVRMEAGQEKARQKTSDRVQGALLADLPLDRFVHFRDPLLTREVKSRFRLRSAGFWIGLVRFALFICGVSLWLFGVFWLTDAQARAALAPYGLRVLLYSGVLCLSVLAATSFTRERESGTWEGLKLSLLTPREILRAKWRSPLISFFYYGAPLWVLLPVGALFGDMGAFVTGLAIVLCWLSLAVALGLWVSWRAPNSTAAMAWSSGVLLFLLVGTPWINDMVGLDASLARWKYGISNDANEIYQLRSIGGSFPTSVIERYQAATGHRRSVRPKNAYLYDMEVEEWLMKQQERAETFVGNLWSWHPGEALNVMFYDTDRKMDSRRRRGRRSSSINGDEFSYIWSGVWPLGLTLVLMAWLRRDIRREQMNS